MRIAIFHDYFRVLGGAERLVILLAKHLKADIITSEIKKDLLKTIKNQGIKVISLGDLTPFPSLLSMNTSKRFSECDFKKKYDYFIFSGNFSIYASKKHKPNLWYCHTPLKGLYSEEKETYSKEEKHKSQNEEKEGLYSKIIHLKKKYIKQRIIPQNVSYLLDNTHNLSKKLIKEFNKQTKNNQRKRFSEKTKILKLFFKFCLITFSLKNYRLTTKKDLEAVKNFDRVVCNSLHTQNKFNGIYQKDSKIVYPPIEKKFFSKRNFKSKNYWLSVNRLIEHKRVELQVESFNKLPHETLLIIGGFEENCKEYVENLKKNSSKNIEYLGFVDDKKLNKILSECKGLITTAKDEDFGMTVVEAMASGKPVIAPNEGGYKESIIDGKTGVLIDNITPEKLVKEIEKMSKELKRNPTKYEKACRERAKEFEEKIFLNKMTKEIGRLK